MLISAYDAVDAKYYYFVMDILYSLSAISVIASWYPNLKPFFAKGPVNPGRITVEGVSAQNDMLVGRHLNPWKLFHMVLIFCFISVGIQIPVVIMH